eukprot:4938110-Prymnesium_polylepis.2
MAGGAIPVECKGAHQLLCDGAQRLPDDLRGVLGAVRVQELAQLEREDRGARARQRVLLALARRHVRRLDLHR